MRTDCFFKESTSKKCNFPKFVKICSLCGSYLKNDGNLESKMKYINYVTQRKYNHFILFISMLALFTSIANLFFLIIKFYLTKN